MSRADHYLRRLENGTTKKDFIQIAQEIRDAAISKKAKTDIANRIGNALQRMNPNFSWSKWMAFIFPPSERQVEKEKRERRKTQRLWDKQRDEALREEQRRLAGLHLPEHLRPAHGEGELWRDPSRYRRLNRGANPWYHGLSRDGMREVFHVLGTRPSAIAEHNDRYGQRWTDIRGPFEKGWDAAANASVQHTSPIQVVTESAPGMPRLLREPGWPGSEGLVWPPEERKKNIGFARWIYYLIDVGPEGHVVAFEFDESVAPLESHARILAKQAAYQMMLQSGREVVVTKSKEPPPGGIHAIVPDRWVARHAILRMLPMPNWRGGRRQRNPWFASVSREGIPEVYWSKSWKNAKETKRGRYDFKRFTSLGPFKTQKDAELNCGMMWNPYYQVMGGKGRAIARPAEGRACDADVFWPPGRKHGACKSCGHFGSDCVCDPPGDLPPAPRERNPRGRGDWIKVRDLPKEVMSDPKFKKEFDAYVARHGMNPVEVRSIMVPEGFPKYMSAWGQAPKVFYDASARASNKGKRVHHFGEGGHERPWLVSSEERGPKFLAYVGGDFEAGGEWIEK